MTAADIAILETRQAEDHADLIRRMKGLSRQIKFLNQRLAIMEDDNAILVSEIDLLRAQQRITNSNEPAQSLPNPIGRPRTRDRLLASPSDGAGSAS